MITIEQVQSILRALSPSNIDIADGTVRCDIGGVKISILASEFDEYLQVRAVSNQSTDTSLYAVGYFEHAIELQGRGPNAYRLFRDSDEITLKHEQTGFVVEISPISSKFIMCLTDTDTMHRDFRRLSMMRRPVLRGKEEVTLTPHFRRAHSKDRQRHPAMTIANPSFHRPES